MAVKNYTTKQGDTWDLIAYRLYGNEYQMHVLMDANPDHIATVIFPADIVLTIPAVETEKPQNLPPWKVKP